MIQQPRGTRIHERRAHLRFSGIGQLLGAPPSKGELKAALAALAVCTWQHPTAGDPVRFRDHRALVLPGLERSPAIRTACSAASCAPMPDSRLRSASLL